MMPLLVAITLLSCDKDGVDERSLVKIDINKITLKSFPSSAPDGSNWDFLSGDQKPDVYITVSSGGSVLGNSGRYDEAESGQLLPYNDHYLITNMDVGITITLYDYDLASDDERIGSVTFFPREIYSDSGGSFTHTIIDNNIELDIEAIYTEE